ncbi:MAG TPA: protein translocase subunit SecF, partial [Candidatus Egerieicola faecale]|nr:protein translocase subunit SecF [Candidatus Egerieicola faecale]
MKLLHRDFHIDFMGKKKIFFIISAACMVIIALWGVIFGVDLDISFKGGTIFTYTYSDANAELDQGALASAAQEVLGEEVEVEPKQDLASNTPTLDISMTSAVTMEESSIDELTAALQEAAPDLGLEYSTITSVNPSIGMDFFGKCLVAVGVGIIIMIIYLGIRFRLINGWKAAITAVLALVHDMVFVYGAFVICGFPLDSNFIAVMLTILGYSANNTVIIYDRIRENTKLFGKKTSRAQIVN